MALLRKKFIKTPLFLILFFLLVGCSSNIDKEILATSLPSPTPAPLSMPSGTGGGVISFVSDRDRGRMDLFLINADGSELIQITHSRDDEIASSWSPDGTKLVYLVSRNNQLNLYTLDLMSALSDPETDHSILLVEDSIDTSPPTWSPDGEIILYSAIQEDNLDLYQVNSDGSEPIQITQTDFNEIHPAISPDGSKLVFCSDQTGTFDLYLVENLNLLDLHNLSPLQLTSGERDELFPTWSPDGENILYTTTANGNKDLVLITWDGSNSIQLTDSPADEWNASWAPDGDQITYSYFNFDSALNDLYVMNLDTNNSSPITSDNFDNWWPSWKP